MTPFFREIAKKEALAQSVLPIEHRAELLEHLGGAACFEVTDVLPLAVNMAPDFVARANLEDVSFLPAPTIWLEFRKDTPWSKVSATEEVRICSYRMTCLREVERGKFVGFQGFYSWQEGAFPTEGNFEFSPARFDLSGYLRGFLAWKEAYKGQADTTEELVDEYDNDVANFDSELGTFPLPSHLAVLLAFINTPDLIGRTVSPPHKGVRKLLRNKGLEEVFKPKPWTQINLSASVPDETAETKASSGPVPSNVLKGQKAFHFCRAHLRVRRGKLELVRAHTRGDKAKGIVRSRYKVNK